MVWEDVPSIYWSMILKMEESRGRAMRVRRWWSRKETTMLPVSPGLEISLTITPDLSPGKRKAEGPIKAKGQIITWSLVAEVKPALAAL